MLEETLGMVHRQQGLRIQILPSTLAHRIEAVVLGGVGVAEIFTAKVEGGAGQCIPTTGIGITMHGIVCLIDLTVLAAAQGNPQGGTEILVTTVTLTEGSVTTEDSYRGSTILISAPPVPNQALAPLTRTVEVQHLIRDTSLVRLQGLPHIQRIIRPLIAMARLWTPIPGVLRSRQRL